MCWFSEEAWIPTPVVEALKTLLARHLGPNPLGTRLDADDAGA